MPNAARNTGSSRPAPSARGGGEKTFAALFAPYSKTFKILLIVAIMLLPALRAIPALAGDTAFVDVARVIDASLPGKAGQRYIDGVKADLDAEREKFKKSLGGVADNDPRLAQKDAQLTARYREEYSRVTGLLMGELKRVTSDWLKTNKRGFTAVLPAGMALAVAHESDVNADILRLFNAVTIDFAKR